MKRLLAFAFLVSCSLGHAQTVKDIDCNTLRVDPNWIISYSTVENFPNPVKSTELHLYNLTKPYSFKNCGVEVKLSGNEFTVKAASVPDLFKVMGGYLSLPLGIYGQQTVGGKTTHPQAAKVSIDLADGLVHNTVRVSGYFPSSAAYFKPGTLMAVRAGKGKLLPLLYNNAFRTVEVDPNISTLSIYLKSALPTIWQAVTLDASRGSLTYYKKLPFPTK